MAEKKEKNYVASSIKKISGQITTLSCNEIRFE